ncbi:MAG TPA: aminotransferase class III-fold pyridoxal phosphate-dependent enzyme, partial [Vicinamibacteria bacterium]|nr:aminotransferase class III-fold pyridoxal phosphate-dependent enzyme [Vicinamibacteria bacterium]
MTRAEIVEKYRKYLYGVSTYYKEPLPFVRGEGKWLEDADGRRYLDFFGGIVTVALGHCEPRVVAALEKQARTLQHVSTLFPTIPIGELAEKLAEIFPGDKPAKSFFTNSGTEAIETAILTARVHTQRTEVVALRHGYHGRTMLSMSLTAHSGWRLGGVHDGSIRHAMAPYCYRCPLGLKPESCGTACAQDVEEVIKTTTSGRPAAYIAEPIMGVGGFITPPKDYFPTVAEIVRRYDALFIADEVQTGWGRTGRKWFGIEQYGVKPDIIVAAKSLGNGHPVGATVARAAIADSFKGS